MDQENLHIEPGHVYLEPGDIDCSLEATKVEGGTQAGADQGGKLDHTELKGSSHLIVVLVVVCGGVIVVVVVIVVEMVVMVVLVMVLVAGLVMVWWL